MTSGVLSVFSGYYQDSSRRRQASASERTVGTMAFHETTEPICAQVGHVYSMQMTIRCMHREEVFTETRVWCDSPDGETERLHEMSATFGPFDQLDEVEAVAVAHATLARMIQFDF